MKKTFIVFFLASISCTGILAQDTSKVKKSGKYDKPYDTFPLPADTLKEKNWPKNKTKKGWPDTIPAPHRKDSLPLKKQ